MKTPIAILGALDQEISGFLGSSSALGEIEWGRFRFFLRQMEGRTVLVAKSGVGKVLAAAVVQRIIDEFSPRALIYTGVAGGINPKLDTGDVVVSRELLQHDFDAQALGVKRGEIPYSDIHIIKADDSLVQTAASYDAPHHKVLIGRILTGDQFITASHLTSHSYLRSELQGDAVEMEGASAAIVAHINRLPFVVIRTISDKADSVAASDFARVLPEIAANSVGIVHHILRRFAVND